MIKPPEHPMKARKSQPASPRRPRGYHRSSHRHPLWRVLTGAWTTFIQANGSEAAATLAYYTIFSIFPLVLVIVDVASTLTDHALVEQQLIVFFERFFPVSQDFIRSNIEQIFAARGAFSLISLITLVWSSTAVFSTLIRNINSAWPSAAPQSFIRMRVTSIGIVLALTLLMILSSFSVTFKNLLISIGLPIDSDLLGAFLSSTFITQVVPILLKLLVLYLLYLLVPYIHVRKRSALLGAMLATTIWQIVTLVFAAYMRTGMQHYEIIYGSLGKIIALLAWTYFTGWIILFCAHLTSSIDRHFE